MTGPGYETSLWAWAVEAYGREGVAEACLSLQDAQGQNIPLLLWAAWSAGRGRADAETLEAACDIARAWDDTVLIPLRERRRALKQPHPDLDTGARLDVRLKIIELERRAERHLMQALESLIPDTPEAETVDVAAALIAVARAWSPRTPRAGLIALAERLSA